MKTKFLAFAAMLASLGNAQVNWQTYPGAANSFWDMDTLNGKLYVSSGLVQEYDGNTWTTLSNYNNSLNTPNKTKSCVKNINGKLYAGAKDFNTNGEGTIHFLSAGTWSLQQNSNFSYNGSNKIRNFAWANSQLYTCGRFTVPGGNFYNIAKWNGNDWVNLGKNFGSSPSTSEIQEIESFQNQLYMTPGDGVYVYDGNQWDSIINPPNNNNIFPMGGALFDLVTYNGELYMSGYFALSATNYGILLMKYNGNSFTSLAKDNSAGPALLSAGTYTSVGKMGVVGNKLYFFATKTSDQNTYLVSYNGSSFTEVSKVANYGDFTFSPGYEIYTFRKIIGYKNDLVIGGNFSKVNGQNITGIAHIPSIVGIEENNSDDLFSIAPNPASNSIMINHHLKTATSLTITDAVGKIVLREDVTDGNTIGLNLPKGIYFVQLKSDQKTFKIQKLIIQ